MKKILSAILCIVLLCGIISVFSGCSGDKTAITVINNDDVKDFTLVDLETIGTETVSISWLDSQGKTGVETFTGIYFSTLFSSVDDSGLNKVVYTATDSKGKKHVDDRVINYSAVNTTSPFIAINKDDTLSLIYPQLSIDMVNKDLWVNNIVKVKRKADKVVLSLSVDDDQRYYTMAELLKFDKTTEDYAWTDIDGSSGTDTLTGVTFKELGVNLPTSDFMLVLEDNRGVEYNMEIDYSFQLERISNYCKIKLDDTMSYDEIFKKINNSDVKIPEPMIAIMKNDSLLLPFPQISGDYNKDNWMYNLVSISIETIK